MPYSTAIIFFTTCILFALLLCLPVFFCFVRLSRRRFGEELPSKDEKLSLSQLLPLSIYVLLLMFLYSQAHIAPYNWLGSLVAGLEGQLWLSVFMTVLYYALSYLWLSVSRAWRNCRSMRLNS
jgi:hypothetical protein